MKWSTVFFILHTITQTIYIYDITTEIYVLGNALKVFVLPLSHNLSLVLAILSHSVESLPRPAAGLLPKSHFLYEKQCECIQ